MTRRLFLFLGLLAVALLCGPAGCGYPKHIDPLLLTYPSKNLALLSAQARAKDIGGIVCEVANTHSMEPVLLGGDYIVVDPRTVYADVRLGQVVTYQATWTASDAPPVAHRALVRDSGGLLVGGDNVDGQHPENQWRVTQTNYIGVVDTIYRVKP